MQACTAVHPAQGQSFIINLLCWVTLLTSKVSEEGTRISGASGLLGLFPLVWVPDQEAEKLRSRPSDQILAPIVPYPMQPDKQGRLVREVLDKMEFMTKCPFCGRVFNFFIIIKELLSEWGPSVLQCFMISCLHQNNVLKKVLQHRLQVYLIF